MDSEDAHLLSTVRQFRSRRFFAEECFSFIILITRYQGILHIREFLVSEKVPAHSVIEFEFGEFLSRHDFMADPSLVRFQLRIKFFFVTNQNSHQLIMTLYPWNVRVGILAEKSSVPFF